MSDAADVSDPLINNMVVLAMEKAERDAVNSRLLPVVFELDNERWGVCHWCESDITPGQLFCPKDPQDTGMCCSQAWDHDHKRRKDLGL